MQSKMRISQLNMMELLKDPKYEGFLDEFRCKQFAKGQLISVPGSDNNDVFIVVSGRTRVYLSYEGREFTLCYLEPGDIFSTHTRAFVEASKESALMLVSAKEFRTKINEYPEFSMIMTRILGDVLGSTFDIIDGLIFHDAKHRLIGFILSWGQETGKMCPEGLKFECDLSMEDIALMIGTTRQTASSLFNNLIRNGYLIREGRNTFVISRLADLKSLLEIKDN